MPELTVEERVLALDIRRSSFAFALFEGPDQLLDWGIHGFRGGVNTAKIPARAKLASLFEDHAPQVLLVRKHRSKAKKGIEALSAVARREATKRGIPVLPVSREAINHVFAGQCRNKEEIAAAVSIRFPQLAANLPPKRKIWKSENYWMRIFDAAATGIAYFAEKSSPH